MMTFIPILVIGALVLGALVVVGLFAGVLAVFSFRTWLRERAEAIEKEARQIEESFENWD